LTAAIKQWHKRLTASATARGGHLEHTF